MMVIFESLVLHKDWVARLCFECSVAACYMVNQLSSNGSLVRLEAHSSKVGIIDAVCINCNKRFKSIRAVSMHLRITGTHHAVNIINRGYYDKKTHFLKSSSA
jgi:hypothetical protein